MFESCDSIVTSKHLNLSTNFAVSEPLGAD